MIKIYFLSNNKISFLEVKIWLSFVKEKYLNQNEKQLVVKGVNTMKKCFGMDTGNGDAPANL